jgi:hypothetical protein
MEGSGTLFDPEVVDAFCKVVAPFPPGTEVKLTDGRTGIVASIPEGTMDRPVVRVVEHDGAFSEVSLLHDTSVGIEGWDHQSVVTPVAV